MHTHIYVNTTFSFVVLLLACMYVCVCVFRADHSVLDKQFMCFSSHSQSPKFPIILRAGLKPSDVSLVHFVMSFAIVILG